MNVCQRLVERHNRILAQFVRQEIYETSFVCPAARYQDEIETHRFIPNPYFLYLTMFAEREVVANSKLKVEITMNPPRMTLTLFGKDDTITGIKYDKTDVQLRNIIYNDNNSISFGTHLFPPPMTDSHKQLLDKVRFIKDEWEMAQIREAILITRKAFRNMMLFLKNDLKNSRKTENKLESIFMESVIHHNAEVAYAPIIASKHNAAYIHYTQNNRVIRNDSFLLMDCGVKNKYGYCADITRTVFVSKTKNDMNSIQQQIYSAVQSAHDVCVNSFHSKTTFQLLNHQCIVSFIYSFANFMKKTDNKAQEHKFSIWNSGIDACIEYKNGSNTFQNTSQFISNFYTHFIGHHVGLIVHDGEQFDYTREIIQSGSVITIEPGLYFKPEILFPVPNEYIQIGGVRIEDMYYVEDNGKLLLLSDF
jgi:Xaa-Pro aminopeptidase